ncbi:MAG: CDP-glycerol glycerophosphotransferase family protein [Parahaliea sp.]
MKINVRKPRHWWLLTIQGLYALIAACMRPLAHHHERPLVVLYGHQLSGNLRALYEQWDKHFRARMNMCFLSLDPEYSQELKRQDYSVLHCNSLRDMITVGRCKVMITDHGLHAMSLLLHLTPIRFIDVWHGIPFKGFDPADFKLQHRYDEIWVSSPLLKKLYVDKFGFDAMRVYPLGYARVDKLFRNDPPKENLRTIPGLQEKNRIVLYAPTWQQDDGGRALFPFGESQRNFTSRLAEICSAHEAALVIRSHLNAQIPPERASNVVYCSMREYEDTEELLLQSDVLICDWSSIAFDYLTLGRPAIFVDTSPPFQKGLSLGPEYRFGGIAKSLSDIEKYLEWALTEPLEYMSEHSEKQQSTLKEIYGKNTDGASAQRQLSRLVNHFLLDT